MPSPLNQTEQGARGFGDVEAGEITNPAGSWQLSPGVTVAQCPLNAFISQGPQGPWIMLCPSSSK